MSDAVPATPKKVAVKKTPEVKVVPEVAPAASVAEPEKKKVKKIVVKKKSELTEEV
jgi:hypothetical protein